MYPYNNYYNPIQQPQYVPQQAQNSLVRVTGIDGAKAYQMSPNCTVALFDSNDDLMYIKSTDGAGFPTIRTFTFTETHEEIRKDIPCDYVTKEEFENFKREVLNAKQPIQSKSTKSKTDDQFAN